MTKKQIEKLSRHIISECVKDMRKNVKRALESGAIDVDRYDAKMIWPKAIVIACLKDEIHELSCKGTSWEKTIKKESENIYAMIQL